MRNVYTLGAIALAMAGCVTTGAGDVTSFRAKTYQEVVLRDGDPTITSRGRNSVVSLRPASHLVADRPVFIVGIQNISRRKVDFLVNETEAGEIVDGKTKALKVFTYDELATQEQSAQAGRSLAVSLLTSINSGMAADGDEQTQAAAEAQNAKLKADTAATAEKNMTDLNELTLKDHTLMPGETYAGKLYLEAPASNAEQKEYYINIKIGADRHEFAIVQLPAVRKS